MVSIPVLLLLLVQAEGGGRRDDVLQACEEVLTVKHRGVLHDESDDTTRDTGCPGVGWKEEKMLDIDVSCEHFGKLKKCKLPRKARRAEQMRHNIIRVKSRILASENVAIFRKAVIRGDVYVSRKEEKS